MQYQENFLKVRQPTPSMPKRKCCLGAKKKKITTNRIDASKQITARLEKQNHRIILLKSLMANKFMRKNV